MRFTKMHGIGNDFVMVNAFVERFDDSTAAHLARAVCDRRFGVGADGLIIAEKGQTNEFAMRMWNPDGSESEMCGNGIRCFANFVKDEGLTTQERIPVETGAGLLEVEQIEGGNVRVDMGKARLLRGEIGMIGPAGESFVNCPLVVEGQTWQGTAVSMGNPHVVMFVPDVDVIDLAHLGPLFEHSDLFPQRVNAHFVQALSDNHIKIRTWERGAGATLACGTGACACGVASYLNGHTQRNVTVSLPGGDLKIEYEESGTVMMTGPATRVFSGNWSLSA